MPNTREVYWRKAKESRSLFTDNFHQHPLAAIAIKFPVEDLFPRAQVEFAVRDGADNFATRDLPFQMGVSVILSRSVVVI